MRLSIIAIGKQKNDATYELTQTYFKRLPFAGDIIEIERSQASGQKRAVEESDKIITFLQMKAIKGHRVIALDKSGADTSSEQLAELIRNWRDEGVAGSYFAIGGADGHTQTLLNSANICLRFGRATWPHLLFRAMLAEQLYRAEMILKDHPYHNGH
jgi:23S rRNA (pseudouridine1915-N3)-methyltransferase